MKIRERNIITEQPEQKKIHDFLNFYPLEPERRQYSKQTHGTSPVAPLPLHNRKKRVNPLAQFANMQRNSMPQNQRPYSSQAPQPMLPPAKTQHTHPTLPQSPPPAPPTPANAAEHFRRINKTLPDGVMYEPLDDETMQILKSAKAGAQAAPVTPAATQAQQLQMPQPTQPSQNAPHILPPPTTTSFSEIAKTIQQLAQNERNAKIFYSGISENAPTETIKKSLTKLAEDCEVRLQKHTQILKSDFDVSFTAEETGINTTLQFADAISLAITEENKSLTMLSSLLDKVEGTPLERQLERIISKKVVTHQMLLAISIRH